MCGSLAINDLQLMASYALRHPVPVLHETAIYLPSSICHGNPSLIFPRSSASVRWQYGVATLSRLLKIIRLFGKRAI